MQRRFFRRSFVLLADLSDNARIADLLGRLTIEEKVELMEGHPKIPRLHLVLSDEPEGATACQSMQLFKSPPPGSTSRSARGIE